MSRKKPQDTQADSANARDERLRAALRANLQRRKAQGRARKASDADAETTPDGQEKGD